MNNSRLSYVDTAKLIAVIFVIVSHCFQTTWIGDFLFSFHVQMFFIVFGFVHKVNSELSIKEYFLGPGKKLFKRIMIPYILLFFILGNPLSLNSFLIMIYGSGLAFKGVSALHLWYLPCYYISVSLYDLVGIFLKEKKIIKGALICLFAIISALLNSDSHIIIYMGDVTYYLTGFPELVSCNEDIYNKYIGFPFSFNVALSCVFLIYIGSLIRIYFDRRQLIENKGKTIVIMIVCIILGGASYYLNRGDFLRALSLANYGNYIFFIITSVSFSMFFLLLSKYIDFPILSKLGKETMTLYIFHPVIMTLPFLAYVPSAFGSRVIVVFLLTCCFIPIIKKIDPSLVGESK